MLTDIPIADEKKDKMSFHLLHSRNSCRDGQGRRGQRGLQRQGGMQGPERGSQRWRWMFGSGSVHRDGEGFWVQRELQRHGEGVVAGEGYRDGEGCRGQKWVTQTAS